MVQHGHDGVTYHVNALGYAYVVTATHVVLPTDDHGVVLWCSQQGVAARRDGYWSNTNLLVQPHKWILHPTSHPHPQSWFIGTGPYDGAAQ